jgi:drug/metabolite transporter (DMT)-like permease
MGAWRLEYYRRRSSPQAQHSSAFCQQCNPRGGYSHCAGTGALAFRYAFPNTFLVGTTGLFLTATLIWGSTWLAIKYQLEVVAPEVSVAYRFGLAAVLLGGWCIVTGRSLRFSAREHGYLVQLGVTFFGLNYIAIYWAERYVVSGLVAVLFSTIVFMNPAGARLAFGTPLAARTFIAATLGVAGVALLFLPELTQASYGEAVGYGVAFGIGGTAIATIGNLVAMRNQRAGIPTFPGTAWGMAYGALTAALVALVLGVPWTFDARPAYLLSLAYLAVFGSIVAFGAYLTLLKLVGAGPSAFVAVSTPVIALALSTLFEGYRWTWVGALGVVLAVAGNWLALGPARRRNAP